MNANPFSQRQWDEPLCKTVREDLISTAISVADHAHLLVVNEWELSLRLQTLPSFNIGTMLDEVTCSFANLLRLGVLFVSSHRCQYDEAIDGLGHHILSCSINASILLHT